jgi:hypothetical protein
MFQIITTYPDGTTQSRDATAAEIAQLQKDEAQETERQWERLRSERNRLLSESDWTVLSDSPTSTAAWKTYRQALRDLPANTTDPTNPVWPTPPS